MSGYDPSGRSSRLHKRVVKTGTEHFDADGVKLEPGDRRSEKERARDDDERILAELPPHWAVFTERE